MGVLIKFSYVKDAHEYFLGIRNDPFEEIRDVLQYYDPTGLLTNKYYMKKVRDRLGGTLIENSEILSIHEMDDADYCRVYGEVREPDGRPVAETIVEAFVHNLDFPEDFDNGFFDRPSEYTFTTDLGLFELYVKRQERFVIRIPKANKKIWFMVPDQPDLKISEIEGTELEIRNPF